MGEERGWRWLSGGRGGDSFLEHISLLKVQEREHALIWKDDKRGKYSVKSYCNSLRAENGLIFPTKEI